MMLPTTGLLSLIRALKGKLLSVLTPFLACLALSGCIGQSVQAPFAPAVGPKVPALPHAGFCPHPVPPALGFIYTPAQVTPEAGGSFLVADAGAFNRYGSKVVEFSPQGKPIWAYFNPQLDFVHSAYPTTRGNILITDTNNNRVIEVNRQCKIVFNTDDLGPGHGFLGRGRLSDGSRLEYPNNALEIPNGHYLITSRMNNTVFEIDRHGHVYWKCSRFINLDGKPDHLLGEHNAQRLANGDTIISDSDNARVVIVNRNCTRELWQYPAINNTRNATGGEKILWPRDAMQMTNGDILVDDSLHNRCLEVSRKGVIRRRYYDLPEPYSCWPMPNGGVASGNANTHGVTIWGPGVPQAEPIANVPGKPIVPPFPPPPKHLVNGGFETGGVLGWQMDDLLTETLPPTVRANLAFDSTVAHSGFSSGRIEWERKTPHAALFWGQVVRVIPYRWYRLSGWMMTKDVRLCKGCDFGLGTDRGDSAYFAATLIRASPWEGPTLPKFPRVKGTTSWHRFSRTFFIPQGVKLLNIQCVLTGKGTAWFDDVKLLELHRRLQPGT